MSGKAGTLTTGNHRILRLSQKKSSNIQRGYGGCRLPEISNILCTGAQFPVW